MAEKLVECLRLIIRNMFIVVMVCIIGATVFIDKSIENKSMNTLVYPNYCYYLVSVIFLTVLFWVLKKDFSVSNKVTWIVMGITFVFVAIWQWKMSSFMPEVHGDFAHVKEAVQGLANGHDFREYNYFHYSKNNVNVVIYLAFLYKIVKDWRVVIFLCALGTNIAAIFIALTIQEFLKDNRITIVFLLGTEMLIALTWRAFLVYTDNVAMPFLAISIFLYASKLPDKWKYPLFLLFITIASYIKVTCMIIVLAMVPAAILSFVGGEKKVIIKKWLYCIACFTLIMGGSLLIQKYQLNKYRHVTSRAVKGWQYMFMVGQNDKYYGVNNNEDKELRREYMSKFDTNKELNDACYQEAIRRVKARGITNIRFFLDKMDIIFGDGYFDKVQTVRKHDGSLKADIYVEGGRFYELFYTLLQVIWFGILLLMLFGGVFGDKKGMPLFYPISIMGITLYTLLFEGRSKYLYMLLPVFIVYAAICMNALLKKKYKLNKKDKIKESE